MNIRRCREIYEGASETLSELVRQLGFAGLAIIWIFKRDVGEVIQVPYLLKWAAVLIVAALAVDLLQYMWKSAVYSFYGRCREKEMIAASEDGSPDYERDFLVPRWFNWPTLYCFWGKAIFVCLSYILMGIHIGRLLV